MKRKYNDFILIILILSVSLGSMMFMKIKKNNTDNKNNYLILQVNGKTEKKLDLSKNIDYTIQNDNGDYNTISIKDGIVKMKDTNCPDKLCIHQGKISKNGETIVCLPHGLIVEIKSKKILKLIC